MLNLPQSNAQRLSLSFNLTETDTLANMIAESKKYIINELILSGVINIPNANYIRDLNKNGSLRVLNLSNVESLHGATIRRIRVYGKKGEQALSDYESPVTWMYLIIHEYLGWDGTFSSNHEYDASVEIIDYQKPNGFTREYIVDYGNYGCWKKTKEYNYSIKWPKDVFRDCSFYTFIMPHNLTVIGGSDCSFCPQSTKNLTIGNNVKRIDNCAFKGAYLGNVEFSSNISEIGEGAFENTTGGILANSFFTNITDIGVSAFKGCKILPNTLSLPNIQELGNEAFMATTIVNVDLGDNIMKLGNSTFENCEMLQTFSGANIETIGGRSFYGCKHLKFFTPSNYLRTIDQEAFANNTDLVSFSIPTTTESIGHDAFANSGLKELDLAVFCNYHRGIISGCDSLEKISVSDNNTKLKSANGVLLSKDESKIITYPCAKEDVLYEISNQVTEVEDSAFYRANKLRALTIPETVSKIGKNAFGNCSIIELKVLPSTTPKVTDNISGLDQSLVRLFVHEKDFSTYYIANYWGDFKNIFVLEKSIFPDNIVNVEVAGTLPEYIGFGNQFKYNILRLSGYLNSDDIRYLREMAGRDVWGNKTVGMLKDLGFSQASIVKGGSSYYIKNEYSSGKLTTSDNIVGESMFEGCNFTNLAISEFATKVGDKALYGCLLESFKLPAATKELIPNSFFGMTTLNEFIVDSDNPNFASINGVLFTKDGKSLLLYPYAKQGERYSTPETTTSIGAQAFGGSNLKAVVTNEGLKEIGTMAFNNLGSLEGISLPSTLEIIGHRAFWGCNNLLDISCKAYYPPTLKCDYYNYYGQPYNNFSDKTYENAVLLVPEKNGGYKSRSGWKLFNNVIESDDWISGILGDVTGDGQLTAADVTALANYILGRGTPANEAAADVNGDTKVDIADMAALIELIK